MEAATTFWVGVSAVLIYLSGAITVLAVWLITLLVSGREKGLESPEAKTETELIRTVRDAVAIELREHRAKGDYHG